MSIVSTLVNAFLTPIFGNPASPAQPPLLWAVLGWVRREFQRTFVNSTPTAPSQNLTISLALPNAVSAPVAFGAVDPDGDALTYTVPARGAIGGPAHGIVTVDQATGTFTYDPDDAYALTGGTDTFTYTVSDAGARPNFLGIPLSWSPSTATGTVALTLNRVNVAPVVNGDTRTTSEDTSITIAVLGNDTDANGNTLTVTGVGPASHGTTTFTASGVTYTPNANFDGTDSFSYTASDGSLTGTATVTVTVTPVDDPPVAVNDSATVTEDSGSTSIDVLANDTDIDAGPKTITGVTQPTNGSVTFTGTTLSYTPNANFNGTDAFSYTLNGGSAATVTMTVTAVNDAPVAADQSVTLLEDTTIRVDPLVGAVDVDGDVVRWAQTENADIGVTDMVYLGRWYIVYTPPANYSGPATIRYKVWDGQDVSDYATVTFTVTPVDDPPIAVNDAATVTEDSGSTSIDVLANDTDVDAGPKTITGVTQPAGGVVTFTGTTLSYTPKANFNGTDTFTYTLNGGSAATVTMTVTPVTDPTVAVDDTATVVEDTPTAINVLDNDTNVDGVLMNITAVTQPANGTVTIIGTTVSYTPNTNYNGTDSFTYTLNGDSTATVRITVTPVNDAPVPGSQIYTTSAGTPVTIYLYAGATDAEGDPIRWSFIGFPYNGTQVLGDYSLGLVTYTPNPGFVGTDSFQYRIRDNSDAGTFATVTINVIGGARPVAVNDTATVAEGGTTTVAVTTNDTDADGTVDTTTVVITRQPTAGTATVNANGSITYANNGTEARTDSFAYTVKDDTGALSNEATVSITVTPVNDAPIALNDAATVAEGGTTAIAVTANDTDADGTVDTTTIVITRQPTYGTATVNSNGTITYVNNGSEARTDSLGYKVKDDTGALSNEATVSITVTPVNDAPIVGNDSYTVVANGTLVISAPGLLANDTDPDGNPLAITAAFAPQHGTLSGVFSSGGFTYRPDAGYVGTDSFRYTVGDGTTTSEGTVTITVTADANNVAPVGNSDSYTIAEDTVLTVNGPGLLANDTDADGQTLSVVSIGTPPTRGSLELRSDGSFTYSPGPNLNGTDTFTYKASDGAAETAFTTVTINVTAVNDVPAVNNDTIPFPKDTSGAYSLLNRVSDADGDTLTASLVTSTQHGTLQFLASQFAFVYTPTVGFVGTDSFTYKVNDGKVDSAVATVTLVVS
ncbi:tandem-95 repeat protein [Mycobacterium yunnanensis]|uniref:Tandem-95 repeat protein n=1 Tax=Mycobacterium yunnanensis TaxID=368477 RepID=A0A9X2YWX9_9MYCO|nr:Ig-like domain-containing protein [Mycobacterium yunnanensis]MCV7419201.1 tandem-95 repeat protein [Mycobacterium yunnanensis]